MSDADDLVAAMVKGDPDETVPLDIVTAMATAALNEGWRPATVYGATHHHDNNRICRCGWEVING